MRELSFDELKKFELDILIEVAKFCDNHNLRYFLAYGTLIGAVRHKGFIPWDDDIDINLPREDYNKLIEIFNSQKENPNLLLVSPYDEISQHTYVKIIDTRTIKKEALKKDSEDSLGVDIDIFPLDGEPEEQEEFRRFYKKLQRIYMLLYYRTVDKNDKRLPKKIRLILPFIYLISRNKKKLLDKAAKIHSKFPYEQGQYVGAVESVFNSEKSRLLKQHFEDFVLLEFEGNLFKCPVGYKEVLTALYGDYMKLPPEEKRVSHHVNKTYLKQEIYDNEKA